MTPEQLKKRVMRYLNQTVIHSALSRLNCLTPAWSNIRSSISSMNSNLDQLIILGRANDRLNINAHVLNAASNIQARITPQGKTYVKEYFSSSLLYYLEKHRVIRTTVLIGALGEASPSLLYPSSLRWLKIIKPGALA